SIRNSGIGHNPRALLTLQSRWARFARSDVQGPVMPDKHKADAPKADAIVLFGATGDLARRSLLPSLYFMDADGFLPDALKVLATARSEMSREAFLDHARTAAADKGPIDDDVWKRFAERISYVAADATQEAGLKALKAGIGDAERPIYYLAISPSLYV